jgi:urease accessory protein
MVSVQTVMSPANVRSHVRRLVQFWRFLLRRTRRKSTCLLAVAAGLITLLQHDPAAAHIIAGAQGGFGSGFAHPLTGADHFLAMFAVGIWGAQMGGRPVWTLPVTFPLIMVVGGIVGIAGVSVGGVEIGIALSVLTLGLAIALAWHPPEWMALALIGFFALCHGHAHGAELPLSADPADYAVGFVLATGAIHLLGIGVGLGLKNTMEGRLSRGLGVVIGLVGVYFVADAVASF